MAVVINVKDDVIFKVYSSDSNRIEIGPGEMKMPSKFNWDPKRKTIFLIHGMKKADELKESIKEGNENKMKLTSNTKWPTIKCKMLSPLAFFEDEDHQNTTTLIKVKWEKGTEQWIDVDVLKNAELVGEHIAKFIEFLGKQVIPTIDTANMEFIGHGVGAHIAAIGMYTIHIS